MLRGRGFRRNKVSAAILYEGKKPVAQICRHQLLTVVGQMNRIDQRAREEIVFLPNALQVQEFDIRIMILVVDFAWNDSRHTGIFFLRVPQWLKHGEDRRARKIATDRLE